MVLARLYYRQINSKLIPLTTNPSVINNNINTKKNFFLIMKKINNLLIFLDENIEVCLDLVGKIAEKAV